MGEKKEYRSSIRSKRMIREAFLALLQEKEYQKITVTDIVNRADINRTTFYAHYPDVLGLFEEVENEIILEMFNLLSEFDYNTFFDDPVPLMTKVIRYFESNTEFLRILVASNGSGTFIEKLKELFEQFMMANEAIPDETRQSPMYQIRISYFSGGIVNIMLRWLTGKITCTPEDIAEQLGLLLKLGL